MIGPTPRTKRRIQRLMIQVEVLLRVEVPGCSPRQVHAFTSAISAHGGLLEAPLRLAPNQRITLVNPNTGMSVSCRVVRADVDVIDQQVYAIAFEFDQRAAQFWPINLPPEDEKEEYMPADA